MSDTVILDRDDGIARVQINRPESMNALNQSVLNDLATGIYECQSDADIEAIVLSGKGEKAFIVGGDITELRGMSGPEWKREFRAAIGDVETAIEERPTPVIAAVDGVALGGGTEIALMCDMIIASENSRFGQPEIGLGLIPGAGGTQRLTQLVGYLKAKEIVLTGRHIAASEAQEIGLINEVVAVSQFENRVSELAETLRDGPATAQSYAKEAINQARGNLQDGLKLEAALSALAFETPEKDEGVKAFIENRKADFNQ